MAFRQCADVTLVDPSSFVGNVMCVNAMVSQSDADLMSKGTLLEATSTWTTSGFNSLSNGLSAAAGGGIGAAVTLFVVGLLFALLAFTGLFSFGKKNRGSAHPSMHEVSSVRNLLLLAGSADSSLGRTIQVLLSALKRSEGFQRGFYCK